MNTDLNDIIVLVRVVETGSFSAAARKLGAPKSTVSRRIARLERALGARLLQRTTRKLGLTDAGEIYYQHCVRALAELDGAQRTVSGMQQEPTGTLRLTAPPDFSQPIVGELVSAYGEKYPDVRVVAETTTRMVDLVVEGFDLALRAGTLQDSSLVARRLATFGVYLYASPAYLERFGTPLRPEELRGHRALLLGSDKTHALWTLRNADEEVSVDMEGHVASNDVTLLRTAACGGRGIARLATLTCFQEERAGRLVRVLPDYLAGETGVYAVFPSGEQLAPKVRAFVELAVERMDRIEAPRVRTRTILDE